MTDGIQGLDKLTAQLYAIAGGDYTPALAKGIEQEILPEMQRLTPVDTGNLRDSEHVEVTENSVLLVAGTDYAVHVEFGTSKMSAQPYMRPAIDTKQDAAMKVTADEISKEMKRVAHA
jgi:HK97 gp10 family phage protein